MIWPLVRDGLFAGLPLAIWLYLLLFNGGFWRARERDSNGEPFGEPAHWPSVTAVVPARDEADVIGTAMASLLAQDYPGVFRIILVDDESSDGTAAAARRLDDGSRLTVMTGAARPDGWTGKLWAVQQGVARAGELYSPDYVWLTDADIAHDPINLSRLICRAETHGLVLTSLMAKLHCRTRAERMFIPAFVYFFAMLYPFAWVNGVRKVTAAAAGGCMLIRRDGLLAAGGIAAIAGEMIDDCAMGRLMKARGPIWLGLTERARSVRPYADISQIRRMVARSAYAQLGYSPLAVAGTLAGLTLMFLAPPIAMIVLPDGSWVAAAAAYGVMAASFRPMLKFYDRSSLWGLALPAIGLLYALFTLDSAVQHWRGRGGLWKGRAQALGQRASGTGPSSTGQR